MKSKLADAMAIDLDVPQLTAKIQRANTKLSTLTLAVIELSTLRSLATTAGQSLKQRVCELTITEKKVFACKKDFVTMNCLVGTSTYWTDATAVLDAFVKYSPLMYEHLCSVPTVFQEQVRHGVCFIPVQSLLSHFNLADSVQGDLVQQMIETFPVLLLEKNKKQALVDIHEMTANGDLFEEILTLDDAPENIASDVSPEPELEPIIKLEPELDLDPELEPELHLHLELDPTDEDDQQKPGTVPLTEQYPEIVPLLTDFLRDNATSS